MSIFDKNQPTIDPGQWRDIVTKVSTASSSMPQPTTPEESRKYFRQLARLRPRLEDLVGPAEAARLHDRGYSTHLLDYPMTCGECGRRTEFVEVVGNRQLRNLQLHHCRSCRTLFLASN